MNFQRTEAVFTGRQALWVEEMLSVQLREGMCVREESELSKRFGRGITEGASWGKKSRVSVWGAFVCFFVLYAKCLLGLV